MGRHSANGPCNGTGFEIFLTDLIGVRTMEYEGRYAIRTDWWSPTISDQGGDVCICRRYRDYLKSTFDDVNYLESIVRLCRFQRLILFTKSIDIFLKSDRILVMFADDGTILRANFDHQHGSV
jgi:hypothetical protein